MLFAQMTSASVMIGLLVGSVEDEKDTGLNHSVVGVECGVFGEGSEAKGKKSEE